jgi:general secretion pathway protein A
MYESFFHLRENPFALTADPRYLYRSKQHRDALMYLAQGVFGSKGFLALTGEVGTGKTTVVRAFLETFRPCLRVAFVSNPKLDYEDLLYMLLTDFGCTVKDKSKADMLLVLNDFLIERYAARDSVVMVIDEAQNLPPDLVTLEELRMVSNLESGSHKLIQVILVGQPELDHMLKHHDLRQLKQRIPGVHRMQHLTREETTNYIGYRLYVAGLQNGSLSFTSESLDAIFAYSQGIPRIINLICDKVLTRGSLEKTRTIRRKLVEDSIQELY